MASRPLPTQTELVSSGPWSLLGRSTPSAAGTRRRSASSEDSKSKLTQIRSTPAARHGQIGATPPLRQLRHLMDEMDHLMPTLAARGISTPDTSYANAFMSPAEASNKRDGGRLMGWVEAMKRHSGRPGICRRHSTGRIHRRWKRRRQVDRSSTPRSDSRPPRLPH